MIINISQNPLSIITPESELESILLESDLFHSKLAFRTANKSFGKKSIIRLNEKSLVPITYDGSVMNIFSGSNETKETSYLLRVALDANSVNNYCIPMHAAYLQSDTKGILLVADTGRGKSLMFNELSGPLDRLIGDDHIVVKDGMIAGNKVARIRNKNGESYYKNVNSEPTIMKPYYMILVDVKGKDAFCEISKDEMIGDSQLNKSILKYLSQDITFHNDKYVPRNIFGENVINKYFSDYARFVENAEQVIKVSGSPEFMKAEIGRVLR